jgi:hypothetical protein
MMVFKYTKHPDNTQKPIFHYINTNASLYSMAKRVHGRILHTIRAVVQQAYLKARVYGCVVPHLSSRSNGDCPILRTAIRHHALLYITLESIIGIE